MSAQTNSKRLAKNTIFMYFRMGFLMLISLYTSRVILQQLGVEDYGIYNVVGSIVVMFNSLKAIFAQSTQRFLSYEMGMGNVEKLQCVYNISTLINIIISVIFVILVEVVGLWFLEFKMNIEPSRIVAAHWVFQFSVLATVISILSTPLDACIIAHERMDFYACISIFEGLAKLGICYLLAMSGFDKLIVYGFFVLIVGIIVRIINQFFCMSQFKECHLKRVWDLQYFKKMTKFAGWAFLGNTAFVLTQSGLNLILNVFGGPIVNAARGISYQVQSSLSQFIANLSIVVKPFAIKTYASGDIAKVLNLVYLTSKVYFIIQLLIVIVVTFWADDLVLLWLGQIPQYSIVFLKLIMIQSLVKSLHMPIDMLFEGEGNIKHYQIVEGIVLALPIPLSYLSLHLGFPYYTVFVILIICELLHILSISILAKYICQLNLGTYLSSVIIPCCICSIIYGIMFYIKSRYDLNFICELFYVLLIFIMEILFMVFCGFSRLERHSFLALIRKKRTK